MSNEVERIADSLLSRIVKGSLESKIFHREIILVVPDKGMVIDCYFMKDVTVEIEGAMCVIRGNRFMGDVEVKSKFKEHPEDRVIDFNVFQGDFNFSGAYCTFRENMMVSQRKKDE